MNKVVIAWTIICPHCDHEHEPIAKEWECVSFDEEMGFICAGCQKQFIVSKCCEPLPHAYSFMSKQELLQ